MATNRKRGRLFARPSAAREITFTNRHVTILRNLARLRLCSSSQLGDLDGGSRQNVERALLALWENGFVERPEAQAVSRRAEEGSRTLIYGLARKGARYLRRNGYDVPRPLLDGIDKQKGAGWRFIEHSVGIAEFFVRLELAARQRKDLRVLERGEILDAAPQSTKRIRLEVKIPVAGSPRKVAVVPDGFFGIHFLSDEEQSFFMYEKDRGEMPVERFRNQHGTYIAKKLHTYLEASRQQKHVNELGIPNFRVLIETTTAERVEQMIDALAELTGGNGSNVFLFIDEATLAESTPIDAKWMSGKRSVTRIID